ncbi:MAG: hypothetical protein QXO21_06495 [Candidatus Anstonellales archaeon]
MTQSEFKNKLLALDKKYNELSIDKKRQVLEQTEVYDLVLNLIGILDNKNNQKDHNEIKALIYDCLYYNLEKTIHLKEE